MTKPLNLRLAIKTISSYSLLMALAVTGPVTIAAEAPVEAADQREKRVKPAEQNQVIYKSVDAQGRVSFGDQPGTNAVELETLERPTYQQNTSPEELQTRLDQMAATTKRLQADRQLRAKLRQEEAEANKSQHQEPLVVIENRVYRPRPRHPYIYKPHYYNGGKKTVSHQSGSSLGLHLGGGRSKFHYGLSYGSQQNDRQGTSVQTPYRREQERERSPTLRLPKSR